VVTSGHALAVVQPVSASLTRLPVGKTFGVQPVVPGNEADGYSDLIASVTAPNPPVAWALTETDPTAVFGCVSVCVEVYDGRSGRGVVITMTSGDLGVSRTAVLGDESLMVTEWAQTGFRVRVSDDVEGMLVLVLVVGGRWVSNAVVEGPGSGSWGLRRSTAAVRAELSVKGSGVGRSVPCDGCVAGGVRFMSAGGLSGVGVSIVVVDSGVGW
jgi:hypothetical protein